MKTDKNQKTNLNNSTKNSKQQQTKQLALALKKNLLRRKLVDEQTIEQK
jgi:hypothetical protein